MATPLNKFSPHLTTLDFFKAAALLIMIIDHIGFYFMVEVLPSAAPGGDHVWWRVVGRLCVPIWFFLIGYANTRAVTKALVVGAVILILADITTGTFIFPLNVLVSMMVIRLILDLAARVAFSALSGAILMFVLCLALARMTNDIMEYGTLGLLIALTGYAVRHRADSFPLLRTRFFVPIFIVAVAFATAVTQGVFFPIMSNPQFFTQAAGTLVVFALLFYVPFREYPGLTARCPRRVTLGVQFLGRRTLEIYVAHLVSFKFIALIFGLGYPIYGWFDWHWTIYDSFASIR